MSLFTTTVDAYRFHQAEEGPVMRTQYLRPHAGNDSGARERYARMAGWENGDVGCRVRSV